MKSIYSITLRAPVAKATMLLVAVCMMMGMVGCASTDFAEYKKQIPWIGEGEEPTGVPVSMVAIWSDTVAFHGRGKPTRGFGGRIYFYDEKSHPIKVDGKLVVYGFDATEDENGDPAVDPSRPQRKFIFTPEQLSALHSESDIGASYSVWIPWDEAGGFKKKINLAPYFSPSDGVVVPGDLARLVLPGKKLTEMSDELYAEEKEIKGNSKSRSGVQQASYSEKASGNDNSQQEQTKRRTTTIRVPPSLGQRMRATSSSKRSSDLNRATVERLRREAAALQQKQEDASREPNRLGATGYSHTNARPLLNRYQRSRTNYRESGMATNSSRPLTARASSRQQPAKSLAPVERTSGPTHGRVGSEPPRAGWPSAAEQSPLAAWDSQRQTTWRDAAGVLR